MTIGLIDVDGHNFPNVALMKIADWHRLRGDDVEWAMPMFGDYDRIYASKVFTFTPDFDTMLYKAKEIVRGGDDNGGDDNGGGGNGGGNPGELEG